jgi:cation:H+ antiporter
MDPWMDWTTVLFFLLGLAILTAGAEVMVKGASRLATAIGVSPLVIGLTVVAYGTSSPELAVSVISSYRGQADLALGNVVGSNIFNVLLILGVSAIITPLAVAYRIVRLDVPLMIFLSFMLYLFGYSGQITRWEGALLVLGLAVYTVWTIRESRKENLGSKGYEPPSGFRASPIANLMLVVAGLGMLMLGSHWLVNGAVAFAKMMGVSELIIGLTIVAAGTSLPEVATSIIASIRGERDIAVGNVIGSNIFNIMSVLGVASLVSPNGIHVSGAALNFDIPVMIAVAVACFPIFFNGFIIKRWEGCLFLGFYAAYTLYLILKASEHDVLPALNSVMLWFVLPLTIGTLLLSLLFGWQKHKKSMTHSKIH